MRAVGEVRKNSKYLNSITAFSCKSKSFCRRERKLREKQKNI